jgi:alpha-L-arabinofuranosidase
VFEMPVKSPEIIEVEKVAVSNQIVVTEQPEVETSVSIAISENEVDIVISQENSEVDITVSTDEAGDLEVSLVEQTVMPQPEIKVSALSLKSIRAKKELEQVTKANIKEEAHLPTEAFNETDFLLQWTKYAQRLSDKGHKIMESLFLIN